MYKHNKNVMLIEYFVLFITVVICSQIIKYNKCTGKIYKVYVLDLLLEFFGVVSQLLSSVFFGRKIKFKLNAVLTA